jgi:hypothetical protein
MVIKSGSYTFGAFLSHPLIPSGSWMGSPASFLFSITLDMRIPYHGRQPPQVGSGSITIPKAFFADREHIEIGNGDLFIEPNLTRARSEIEGCFGIGLTQSSREARGFLAGSSEFSVDELEVWSV